MQTFYEENFHISNIIACVRVPKGGAQRYHKNRPTHGLMLKLSGRNEFVFADGTVLCVQAGDVCYLPKFADYEVRVIEAGECIAVNFDLCEGERTYPPFVQTSPQSGEIKKHFDRLLYTWNTQKTGYGNACFARLYAIICAIQQKAAGTYVPSRTKRLVLRAVEIMQARIADPALTVAQVAAELGVTPEYFRKLFREVYAVSPRRYLIDLRMRKAQALLLSGEFTVSETAVLCGYDSDSYFSGEFKRACGCVPSAYVEWTREKSGLTH